MIDSCISELTGKPTTFDYTRSFALAIDESTPVADVFFVIFVNEYTTLSVLGAKIALALARPGYYDATTVANGASLGVPSIPRQPRKPSPDPLRIARTCMCAPVFFLML